MGLFKRLFGKPATPDVPEINKSEVPVYPMLKAGSWPGMERAEKVPYVVENGHLEIALVFAQDAGERFEYLLPEQLADEAVAANFRNWQDNIDQYPYEFEFPERLGGRILFASGEDHAAEKILSPAFLEKACLALNTDRLLISAPRRRCLMMTSYHEDFPMLENFFNIHFVAYRDEAYGNELITEMIFTADQKAVDYAVPLGFRMNMYEKDGQRKLVYNTMDDLFAENGQIDFQQIIERKKIPVSFKKG